MDVGFMNTNVVELKQFALKISFLNKEQRARISSELGDSFGPIQVYLDQIEMKFPSMSGLSKDQQLGLWRDLALQPATKNGWELVRRKIDSMRQEGGSYPSKLYTLLFE